MFGNGKIFISHAHDDNQRSQPLLAALDAWQIDYWFDTQELDAGQRFSDRIQQALSERDIFLRIGTTAAVRSFWMNRELRAVRGLQTAFPQHARHIIHLALTPDYVADAGTQHEVVIDTTKTPRIDWLRELHQALGFDATAPRVSRRAAIGIGAASLAATVATAIAGKLYFTPQPVAVTPFKPQGSPKQMTPQSGDAHLRWRYNLNSSAITLPVETNAKQISLVADSTALYVSAQSLQNINAFAQKDGTLLWLYPEPTGTSNSLVNSFVQANEKSVYLLANFEMLDLSTTPFTLIALENATRKVKWQISVDVNVGEKYSRLCITDANIFFQANGKVYAYTQDGTTLWPPVTLFTYSSDFNAPTPIQQYYSTPAFANGLLYLGMGDGKLYALDAATGKTRWVAPVTTTLKVGDPTFSKTVTTAYPIDSSPAVADGIVAVGGVDGYCYCFDAATGALRWKEQLVTPNFVNYYTASVGSPTIAEGVIYLQAGINDNSDTFSDGLLFALDAHNGKVLWKLDPLKLVPSLKMSNPTSVANDAPPLVMAGSIYYSFALIPANLQDSQIGAEYLVVVDKATGTLQWSYSVSISNFESTKAYFPSSPVPVPGGVAFTSNEPTVYVFDL